MMESLAVTDVTAITSAVLFRSENKGSGFHAMNALNFSSNQLGTVSAWVMISVPQSY